MPPEARLHLLNAQRELLLALTATIDHHIKQHSPSGEAGGAGRPRPVRVELE